MAGRGDDFIDVLDGDTDDVVQCGKGKNDSVNYDVIGTLSDELESCELVSDS